jgi:hypothetical protein
MDDSQANNGLPLGRSAESLSESHPAESMNAEATDAESTQTLAIPSNGSSQRKIEANRGNAKKSTGPKTSCGKAMSSWNSTRHGLLSKGLPAIDGQGKEQFTLMLTSLQQDLEPVGTLEEVLVEKIAQEYWRLSVAAWHEKQHLAQEFPFMSQAIDRILRYQTTINRQLFQAMNQLERLQRLRKGDNVPAPLNVQLLRDTPTIPEEENSDR